MTIENSEILFDYSVIPDINPFIQSGFVVLDAGEGGVFRIENGFLREGETGASTIWFNSGSDVLTDQCEVKFIIGQNTTNTGNVGAMVCDASSNGYAAIVIDANQIDLFKFTAGAGTSVATYTFSRNFIDGDIVSLKYRNYGSEVLVIATVNYNELIDYTDISPFNENIKPALWFQGTETRGVKKLGIDYTIVEPTYVDFEFGFWGTHDGSTNVSMGSARTYAHTLLSELGGSSIDPFCLVEKGDLLKDFKILYDAAATIQLRFSAYIIDDSKNLTTRLPNIYVLSGVTDTGAFTERTFSLPSTFDLGAFLNNKLVPAFISTTGASVVAAVDVDETAHKQSTTSNLPNPWAGTVTNSDMALFLKMTVRRVVWPGPPALDDKYSMHANFIDVKVLTAEKLNVIVL